MLIGNPIGWVPSQLTQNIGLIFIIPGLEETLRFNGIAYVTNDE